MYLRLLVAVFLIFGIGYAQDSNNEAQLSLEDCINLALEYNSTLRQAEFNNEAADYDVTASYSDILPSVNLSFRKGETTVGRSQRVIGDAVIGLDPITGDPIYGTAKITTPKQYYKDNSFSVSVNQTIFDGGRWWNNIERAQTDKEASDFDLQSSRDNTILNIQSLYYDLLKQKKLYEADKVAVERSEGQVTRTQKMFDLGAAAKLDVYQAKVNLGNDRITMLTQENILGDAHRKLNIALGRDPGDSLNIQPVKEEFETLRSLDELVDDALTNQPLINKGAADISSSELGVSLAKANYYPSLGAYFQYSRRNSDLERIYTDLNFEYVWAVGLSLNWNLFNGFGDYVNVQKSKIMESSTREAHALYIRELQASIKAKYDNYISYKEIVQINEENLEAAKEELRLAEERHQIGAGTFLEVREAQVKLTRAEQTLIAARYNALITLAQLDTELGITEKKLSK
jgi:outer membrane protein